jgi:hypothetical protein
MLVDPPRFPARAPDRGWFAISCRVRARVEGPVASLPWLVGSGAHPVSDKPPARNSLRFGVMFGYWQAQPPPNFVEVAQEAERLGFHSAWTAEAWGSDAFSPLT